MIQQSSSKSRPLSPTTPKRISCSFFDKEFLPQFSRCVRDAHDIYIHRLYLKRIRRNVPWYWIARMHFRWATSYLLPFAYSLFVERNSWTTLECCCPNLCGHHSQLSPAPLSVLASVRSELRQPLLCGYCFYPQPPHPFQFSSHHIGKLFAFLAMPLQCDMVRGVLDGFV